MRKVVFLAAMALLLCAVSAAATDWQWVWRGVGDPSATPIVKGSRPWQTGQETCVYNSESLSTIGPTRNWWDVVSDPTYGEVTLLHHAGTTTRLDFRGYGNDTKPPAQCGSHWTEITKLPYPAGTVPEDGMVTALRLKVIALDISTGRKTRMFGSQWYWIDSSPGGTGVKFGPRQQLGIGWDGSKVELTHRSGITPTTGWSKICNIADQATQGGPVTNSQWVDVVISCKRNCPNCYPVVGGDCAVGGLPRPNNMCYDYYVWWSTDGGATWNNPVGVANPVLTFNSESPDRFDINIDPSTTGVTEVLMDYYATAPGYVDNPANVTLPSGPKPIVTDLPVGQIKAQPQGTLVKFNAVLTARYDEDGKKMYHVEDPDSQTARGRDSGLKVWMSNQLSPKDVNGVDYTPSIGDYVRVVGSLGKLACDTIVYACSITQQPKPQGLGNVTGLGMNNRSVVWSYNKTKLDFIPAQPASGSGGLRADGLLARLWGKITYKDPLETFFYIDDGTGYLDGDALGAKGIRVFGKPPLGKGEGDYAVVEGVIANYRKFVAGSPPIDFVLPSLRMVTGAVTGKTWEDVNIDGIQQPEEGEPVDATVELYSVPGDALMAQATTDFFTGAYAFVGVPPGSYYVKFTPVQGAGWLYTLKDQGGDDTKDSDADQSTGKTDVFVVKALETQANWDCGGYYPAAK